MGFQDRYGITKIIDKKINNLSVNWDFDDNADDKTQRFPVLFFTPDMNDTKEHYHIRLDRVKAQVLRDWLDAFLKDVEA